MTSQKWKPDSVAIKPAVGLMFKKNSKPQQGLCGYQREKSQANLPMTPGFVFITAIIIFIIL